MLARTLDAAGRFTRRDAVRLAILAFALVGALTVILGADMLSTSAAPQVGDTAPATIRAPHAATYVSEIQTAAARDQAARDVAPLYDYTLAGASAISDAQVAQFRQEARRVDLAFALDDGAARRVALEPLFPELSPAARLTLDSLDAIGWATIRETAAQVLGERERVEIKDTALVEEKATLPGRFPLAWTGPEKQLAAELVAPFVTPNSSYSASLTDAARTEARQAVAPVSVTIRTGSTVVDAGAQVSPADAEALKALGLDAGLDLVRGAGWLLLSALLVLVLLAWIWRFRRELWHRNNALLLVSVLVLAAIVMVKLTAGRSILPFFLPLAAVGIILAVLLGSGPAMIVQAMVAIIAGAANGSSLEIATYFLVGGVAGIITIHRGDRIGLFIRAGAVIAVVNVLVVTVFSLLGERDLTGIAQLLVAGLASAAGAAIASAGLFAVLGNLFGIATAFQLQELANPTQPLLRRLLTETSGNVPNVCGWKSISLSCGKIRQPLR